MSTQGYRLEHKDRPDPVIQSSFWQPLMTSVAIPAPIRQWAGMGNDCNGRTVLLRRPIPMAQLGKLNTSKW